jgi:beta-lactam-binding protein with PASTA domain
VVVLLLLILGLFYGFGTSQGETSVTSAVPVTRVPNVTGLAPASAARRIRGAGLVPAQARCSAAAAIWSVRGQRPSVGSTVSRGSRVLLTIAPARRHTPCNAYSGTLP